VCGGWHGRRKQWSGLSERTRRLLVTAAVAEGILKVAAVSTSSVGQQARSAGRSGCGPRWWLSSALPGSCRSRTSCSGGGSLDRSPTDPICCRRGLERREASDRRDQKPAVHTGVHAGPVSRGVRRAPAVTTSSRGIAGQVAGEAATSPLIRRRARDRVSQACGHDSGQFSFVRFRCATSSSATSACRSSQASPASCPRGVAANAGGSSLPRHRDSPGWHVGEEPSPQQIGHLLR
jgi:hypothetical protein